MQSPTSDSREADIHRKRNWIATIATFAILFLIASFAWRVFSYLSKIKDGTINPSTFSFVEAFSSNMKLAAIPVSEEVVDVTSTDDPSLGRSDAALTIVEFADFGCPFSREVSYSLRELAIRYPDKFHYIYRDFPITDLHPIAQKSAEAGECAAQQGRFWEYHDKLYQNQSDLSEARLTDFAREIGLNAEQFESCLDSGRMRAEVEEDSSVGISAGVRGTPTFFLNGVKIEGAVPKNLLEQWIKEANP